MNALDIEIIEAMTLEEAQQCCIEIRSHLHMARQKVLEFYQRLGWQALGYDSFQTCVEKELGYSFQHGYRLLTAAEVEYNIRTHNPPGNALPASIPEKHTRELKNLDPQKQAQAYAKAQKIAEAEGGSPGKVTTSHVQKAIAAIKAEDEVFKSAYYPVNQMVASGEITATAGSAMVLYLDRLPVIKRGYLLQLIARPGLTHPELILPIADMFDRPEGKESYVLPEILRQSTLAGTPLAKAGPGDLARAREIARRQHIQDAVDEQEANGKTVAVICTVYRGDTKRTLKSLEDALGGELVNLAEALLDKFYES